MKMTGHFLVIDNNKFKITNNKIQNCQRQKKNNSHPLKDPYNQYIHLYLELAKSKTLAFSDLRKFGKSILYFIPQNISYKKILNLILKFESIGQDAWNYKFSNNDLQKIFGPQKSPIKQLLLNQKFLAGIGNIYADEILFEAEISPLKPGNKINLNDFKKLNMAIKRILNAAIKLNGTSERDFRLPNGEKGQFQNFLKVYRRNGQTCYRSEQHKIIRKKIGGRYAHYCPICQKY
jgi:formamidopyrimidine-DNA glycosylase